MRHGPWHDVTVNPHNDSHWDTRKCDDVLSSMVSLPIVTLPTLKSLLTSKFDSVFPLLVKRSGSSYLRNRLSLDVDTSSGTLTISPPMYSLCTFSQRLKKIINLELSEVCLGCIPTHCNLVGLVGLVLI